MINEIKTKKYCCEDISLIENYELAINDKSQVWHIHHRWEVSSVGIFSRDYLISIGIYWNRPANELIFLTKSDHTRIHKIGNKNNLGHKMSEDTKDKIRGEKNGMFGKHHSIESRKKMSIAKSTPEYRQKKRDSIKKWMAAHDGHGPTYGHKMSEEQRKKLSDTLIRNKSRVGEKNSMFGRRYHWINNGHRNKKLFDGNTIPDGWVFGWIKLKKS